MSLILDALKRSEKERQEKAGPDAAPAAPEADGGGTPTSRWRIAGGVVAFAFAGLAIGGGIGYFGLMPSDAPQQQTQQPRAPAEPASKQPENAAAPAVAEPPAAPQPAATTSPPAAPEPKSAAMAPPPVASSPPAPVPAPEPQPSEQVAAAPAPTVTAPAPTPGAAPQPAPAPGRLAGIAVPRKKPSAPFVALAMPVGASEAQVLTQRGRTYEDKGLYDQAIATYSQAIDLDPGFADAYFGRGWARVAKGAYDAAAGDFQRTIALRPDAADAYYGRAWALELEGDRAQAIRQYGEAIRIKPDHVDAHFSRGVLEFMAGHMAAAARDFAAVHESATGRLKDYALLWRYVSKARGGVIESSTAFDAWRDDSPWPGMLVRLFRGEATPTQVLVAAKNRDETRQRENECIALFFIGQHRLIAGDAKGAAEYFRRTLATGVTNFRQHAAAAAELKRLEQSN